MFALLFTLVCHKRDSSSSIGRTVNIQSLAMTLQIVVELFAPPCLQLIILVSFARWLKKVKRNKLKKRKKYKGRARGTKEEREEQRRNERNEKNKGGARKKQKRIMKIYKKAF